MENKKYIKIGLIAVAVIALIVAGASLLNKKAAPGTDDASVVIIPGDDAFDVTVEFFDQWLAETQSTTTNPFDSGLINSTRISAEVRTMIQDKKATKVEGDLDAVFCQSTVPERLGGKEIYKNETKAQVMILARGYETKSPYQAVVTVDAVDGNWQITKIECLQSEVAPESEYDFERSGFLLKSVVAPLDPQYWHLVYEENGQAGHALPLFFDADSICITASKTEAVCDPSQFVEPAKVLLQADMLEAGADVRRVTFE